MTQDARGNGIGSLSTELLSIILANAISAHDSPIDLHEKLKTFERSRLVCRRWNNAIEGDPLFWSSCSVAIEENPKPQGTSQISNTLQALKQHFSRSGSLPLALGISLSFQEGVDVDGFSPIVRFIASFSDRWRSLYFNHWESAAWDGTQNPWWLSLLQPPSNLRGDGCCRNLQQLTLESTDALECYLIGGDVQLSQAFPNVSKLDIGIRYLSKADDLLNSIVALQRLAWIRISVHDADVQDGHGIECAARLVFGLLAKLPLLEYFEAWLENLENLDDEYDDPAELFPSIPLVHSTLTSLKIMDAAHLRLLCAVSFPALQKAYVENNIWDNDNHHSFSCLQQLFAGTRIQSLGLIRVEMSSEDLIVLLHDLPSLKLLQIASHTHRIHGDFLSQLYDRSKTTPVLPHLVSLTINLSFEWDVSLFQAEFKTFVEDPRRSGEDVTGTFELLRHAVLLDNNQNPLYSRIIHVAQT
ncbi:hypothetical protein BKA70DRAFT_1316474 [Coprinopsis sp. MPI-PUGE-AT-0042]|nr:hypothetical protein BKA70DRAFT_1316474 [Coprinopsis sp. MPI-PUGE-AT-0042]